MIADILGLVQRHQGRMETITMSPLGTVITDFSPAQSEIIS